MKPLRFALACALAVLIPSAAFAYPGINLAWGNCLGAGGLQSVLFACNTNSDAEAHLLVCSFRAPPGITAYVANQATIELHSADAVLPAWWQLKGAGQCRTGSAIADANFTGGPAGCTDVWLGAASGALASFNVGYGGSDGGRMNLVFAVPLTAAVALTPDEEYYAFKVLILNTKTTGAGSCAGCASPMCIWCTRLSIEQPAGAGGNFDLYDSNYDNNSFVTWNGGRQAHGGPFNEPYYGCVPDPTPTRSTTWGMIKSIYR